MERLRIEFGGKGLDPCPVDPQPPGAEGLPHGEVLEISLARLHHSLLKAHGGPRQASLVEPGTPAGVLVSFQSRLPRSVTEELQPLLLGSAGERNAGRSGRALRYPIIMPGLGERAYVSWCE